MFHVEHRAPWWDIVVTGSLALGLSVDERVLAQLSVYLRELRNWNRKINLSGFEDPEQVAIKHFLDSLAGANILKHRAGEPALDVGAGAGFPGLPLKILFPSLPLRLLDPNSKKTAFMRHVIGTLDLKQVEVSAQRVQDLAADPTHRGQYSSIVTRAVHPREILSAATMLLAEKGKVILWRTGPLDSEALVPGLQVNEELTYTLPKSTKEHRLTILKKH